MKNSSLDFSTKGKVLLKSLIFGLLFGLIMIFILTLFYYFIEINQKFVAPVLYTIMIVCIVFSCFYVTKRIKAKGWLSGLIVGFMYYIILLLVGLISKDINVEFMNSLSKLIYFILIGIIGGCIGVNLR